VELRATERLARIAVDERGYTCTMPDNLLTLSEAARRQLSQSSVNEFGQAQGPGKLAAPWSSTYQELCVRVRAEAPEQAMYLDYLSARLLLILEQELEAAYHDVARSGTWRVARKAAPAALAGVIAEVKRHVTAPDPGRHQRRLRRHHLHTYSRHLVHFDLEWNPARMEQREGRIDRLGRALKEPARIYYLLVKDTYDERMFHQLIARQRWHGVLLGRKALQLGQADAPTAKLLSTREAGTMSLDLDPRHAQAG
jgi:hypothetical protein